MLKEDGILEPKIDFGLNAFFFELDRGEAETGKFSDGSVENTALSTESWHLQLKNEIFEQLFVVPNIGFQTIWQVAAAIPEAALMTDLKAIVNYSFSKAAVSIQERNRSPFMFHVLHLIKASESKKFLPLLTQLLKQPSGYFELFFNTFPKDALLEALFASSKDQESKLLTNAKGKDIPPKGKYIFIEAYIQHAIAHAQPGKLWAALEKFLNQAEKINDATSIPKDFFNQITKLFINYRLEHFEYYIRQLFMFGLVKPERIGSLEDVLIRLNETFDLRNTK